MKKIYTLVLLALATFSVNAQDEALKPVEGPRIMFEKQVHDYGQIQQGADGNCEFVFTNVGTEPLVLQNVNATCGCTVPSWPREPIMPGEKGTIRVRYDTHRLGNIGKAITVTSNSVGDNSNRITLRITGHVNPAQN
ncbi:MAG: DUF1573 domain-containing protein [Bacteroidales bacterium]|jgi:hypothetical protein|nr:DUF1573 domain-containing protein [Bacteroidales bacterium]